MLASGETFAGNAFGDPGPATGEVVFNTSMTGYQEILTDPSYRGQLVCMTVAHVGIVGTNPNDNEAKRPQAAAMVVRSLSQTTSNWRSNLALGDYFTKHKVTGISEVDTRRLTKLLRDKGAVNGCIVHGKNHRQALRLARECRPMAGYDLASKAGARKEKAWVLGSWSPEKDVYEKHDRSGAAVALIDCGAKAAIMRELSSRGLAVTVLPYGTGAKEIAGRFAGLVLSNGPGDPRPLEAATETARALIKRKMPVMGICLGHQLLAQASGARITKMKFGHHGANHPVLEKRTGRVFISSQNHGFTVDQDDLPPGIEVTHVSLFDGSVQGFRHTKLPVMGFQGHPEASPGPRELTVLFDDFAKLVRKHAKKP